MGRDKPTIPEWIAHSRHAVAVGLVRWLADAGCSRSQRLGVGSIAIFCVEEQAYGRTAEVLDAERFDLRRFVGHHDDRIADLNLGVSSAALLIGHSELLFCAERLHIKRDCFRTLREEKIRLDAVISVWNGFELGHNTLHLRFSPNGRAPGL